MPLPTLSFVLGLVVLLYLSTFILFALLRIITGVSIQRVGLSGLRRIALTPRDGIDVRIRGVGFSLHRPTFAQPTWISLTITEVQVILDLKALEIAKKKTEVDGGFKNGTTPGQEDRKSASSERADSDAKAEQEGGRTWKTLTRWKERIKLLHRQIQWLRLVDVVVLRSSVAIKDVGAMRVERFTLSVDTRSKTVDRTRLFQHYQAQSESRRPAEWKSIVRSILFTPEGKDSTEILDYCTFSVHGFLQQRLDGLRDASIALKLGRLTIPYDDLGAAAHRARQLREEQQTGPQSSHTPSISLNDVAQTINDQSDTDDRIVQTVSDSKDFVSSILRGIQEVQLAVSFVGLSKRIENVHAPGQHAFFNLAMKEVGLDLMRLDSRSPAHRMYFSSKDVAHQALLTAISIAAGVDDGHDHPERMLYIPMVTATVKTTLPSKTIQYSPESDAGERNTNILFANLVCTSPSLDLDPKHLPLILAILRSRHADSKPQQSVSTFSRHELIGRLLPKATVKIAIQEPVIRVSLPPLDSSGVNIDRYHGKKGDYDMIISSTSSMSLDIESQHATDGQQRYGLTLNYRQTSHHFYGQTFAGVRHDLLYADTIEVKVDINALPETSVFVGGRFQTLSIYLIQPDICEGLRQIVVALRKDTIFAASGSNVKKPSFLRRIPAWLQHIYLQGSDFNMEIAGVDKAVSREARGLSLQLESWSTEYKAHRDDNFDTLSRRKSISKSAIRGGAERSGLPNSPRKAPVHGADGRRLAVHVHGLEGTIVDSTNESNANPFLKLPKFEVAFSTSTDPHGALFHINTHVKKLFLYYSLYNHFAIGIACLLLKRTFTPTISDDELSDRQKQHRSSLPTPDQSTPVHQPSEPTEITTFDIKAGLVQIKAQMPADPALMLQLHGIEAGQHRWANPFVRTKLARLYASTSGMKSVWSRILGLKTVRIDLRTMKRKVAKEVSEERSIDVAAEAIRIGVPHQLIVHNIFDNVINVIKTSEQLHHHFSTGNSEYILAKHPEGPKHIPKISLRSQVLIFEIEDSGFEWKLGTIYRIGLIEQKQRLARAEAFRLKEKKIDSRNSRRPSAQSKTQGTRTQQRERSPSQAGNIGKRIRSKSKPGEDVETNGARGRSGGKLRYDAEGKCDMGGTVHRSTEQAREGLHRFNAQSWKKRIDSSFAKQNHAIHDLRAYLWGPEEEYDDGDEAESIMRLGQRPALMAACISDLSIAIDKPSFPLHDLPQFLHDIGKGMPLDMEYGLLVPMNLSVSMGEARVMLRDYPLPLLHVPAIRPGQSPRLPSLSLSTDFVIAEEYRDMESQRHVTVEVVPPEKLAENDICKRFAIDVRRTISPVKTYSNMKIEINTSAPTRITWGTSYQPAIQDMMQVIESFTKPAMDPSDRVGFWDKIRLSFHSRLHVSWKGDGDVHLNLKGSRDPYVVTGYGAGLVMVWRNGVRLRIAQDSDPKKFMTVDSGDYILAIPDFNHYARTAVERDDVSETASTDSTRSTAMFKKVIMKLSGNVQWLAGLVFERGLEGSHRSFDFEPHYSVVLKHPDHARAPPGRTYDAFYGFRSQHIHMSLAVIAPHTRDWNVSNIKPSENYNSVHLSPRFFTHFLNWWSLFSGVMSLPVRQGPLWGSQEKSSKKFGRHLATIKYNLLLSPVFIAHVYKHKDAEEYKSDVVAATGLKMKLDSFMLDLHQRRETFEIPGHEDAKPKKTSGMRINECQLDCISGDVRALSASIHGTSLKDVDQNGEAGISTYQNTTPKIDMSRFTIPDNDFSWIDMDDLVELDWVLPSESNPETKILPLASAPRFTYFRQTDHGDSVSGDATRSSPFGDEPTHFCVISAKNDPRRVQVDLIQDRLNHLVQQLANNERASGEQQLNVIKSRNGEDSPEQKLQALKNHGEHLLKKHAFLDGLLKSLLQRLQDNDSTAVPDLESIDGVQEPESNGKENANNKSAPLDDNSSDFNNRFVVHNAQIKWNDSLRNIILRYIHQVSQRRGFVYFMSRRAVKFIVDILEEQKRQKPSGTDDIRRRRSMSEPVSPGVEDENTIQDRIDQILHDGRAFVDADDSEKSESHTKPTTHDTGEEISTEFTAQNNYHFRLIAPQIQLQSEKNQKSVVLITAKGIQFKVVQIMDKDRLLDEVSGLVQRRFNAAMDAVQVFVASSKTFPTEYLHMYSGNRYGTKAGSCWPPWVPMEVMYEYAINPFGFSRVVQRTSASLRYEKFNTLRLKYNEGISTDQGSGGKRPDGAENRMDHVWVEFPHFRAICDSAQYYALYIIVVDLLLYNEPLEKTRSERLEKIMLASDFSDLTGAPEMVEMLQDRIHQLEEIKMHFQINEKMLDRQGWKDRISMDQDLASCEDELFFMMKAITTAQQRMEDRNQQESTSGMLRWLISAKEIAWHLIREKGESLMEFQLKDGLFDRTDHSDGSNTNCIEIGRINGYNLLRNALYPQIIGPYIDESRGASDIHDSKMLRVQWLMLEAIAGIPVVDSFEVDVVPIRVQLERDVAKKVFEYIFPGVGGNAFEGSGFSPFMVKHKLTTQEEEDESVPQDADASTTISDAISEAEHHQGTGTGTGALEQRLQPTLKLSDPKHGKPKKHGLGIINGSGSHSNLHHWSIFQHSNRSSPRVGHSNSPGNSTPSNVLSRTSSQQSVADLNPVASSADSERTKKSAVSRRSAGTDKRKEKEKEKDKDKDKDTRSDDLTQMMSRASSYMTLAFVKVHGMVLCLSYKGRGQRNLEDVHDLVFRMPTLEYRNKTWSNLDLALQLKKDVIKALISHAGAIVGNKFSHHRPSKQQQSRFREIANSNTLLSITQGPSGTPSEDGSTRDDDPYSDEPPSRPSFATSGRGESLRSPSYASSKSTTASPLPPSRQEGQSLSAADADDDDASLNKEHPRPHIRRQQTNELQQNGLGRSRGSSLSRHFTGLGQRLRTATDATGDESEESTTRKSRLLLGGQKLLRSLPHRD